MINLHDIETHDRPEAVFLRPTKKATMNELPTVGEATLAMANSPKVAAVSAGGGIGMGLAAKLELINSILGTVSMAIGVVTGTVICAVWMIKLVRYWRDTTTIEPKEPA